jgi:hypothetical protein
VNTETQAACGFALSACSAISSFALAWMPLLQIIAVIVAIVSGVFALVVSGVKLYDRFVKGHKV